MDIKQVDVLLLVFRLWGLYLIWSILVMDVCLMQLLDAIYLDPL